MKLCYMTICYLVSQVDEENSQGIKNFQNGLQNGRTSNIFETRFYLYNYSSRFNKPVIHESFKTGRPLSRHIGFLHSLIAFCYLSYTPSHYNIIIF